MNKLAAFAMAGFLGAGCTAQVNGGSDTTLGGRGKIDGGTVIAPDDAFCGGAEFALTKVRPNMMLVLDRSGSMGEAISAGVTKWDDLRSAVGQLVSAYKNDIQFGASLFADPARAVEGASYDDSCTPGKVSFTPAPENAQKILDLVNASSYRQL